MSALSQANFDSNIMGGNKDTSMAKRRSQSRHSFRSVLEYWNFLHLLAQHFAQPFRRAAAAGGQSHTCHSDQSRMIGQAARRRTSYTQVLFHTQPVSGSQALPCAAPLKSSWTCTTDKIATCLQSESQEHSVETIALFRQDSRVCS